MKKAASSILLFLFIAAALGIHLMLLVDPGDGLAVSLHFPDFGARCGP